MLRQEAIRLKTACNLFWGALCAAADKGDVEALDRYVKRYGWLAGSTIRAWIAVGQAERDAGHPADLGDALEAAKEVINGG